MVLGKVKKVRRALRRTKRAHRKMVRIDSVLEREYPKTKRMSLRTFLRAAYWMFKPRMGWPSGKSPIKVHDYLGFYQWLILRTAEELKKNPDRPIIIALGGIAAIGKSIHAKRLEVLFEDIFRQAGVSATRAELDWYFMPRVKVKSKTRRGRTIEKSYIGKNVRVTETGKIVGGRVVDGEYDNPAASDLKKAAKDLQMLKQGRQVTIKQRNVTTGEIKEIKISPRKRQIIIIEGLYSLYPPLAKHADIRIGLMTSLGTQMGVRYERDTAPVGAGGRGRDPTEVARKFVERESYQRRFVVKGTLKNAELIFDAPTLKTAEQMDTWATATPYTRQYKRFLSRLLLSRVEFERKRGMGRTLLRVLEDDGFKLSDDLRGLVAETLKGMRKSARAVREVVKAKGKKPTKWRHGFESLEA